MKHLPAFIIAAMLMSCATTPVPEPFDSITLSNDCVDGYVDTCPIYRFTIFSDDTYFYEGDEKMEYIGVYRGKTESGTFARAKVSLEKNGFWQLSEDYYASPSIDCESYYHFRVVIVRANIENQRRSVYHDLNCKGFAEESSLLAIESLLEKQLGIAEWTIGD